MELHIITGLLVTILSYLGYKEFPTIFKPKPKLTVPDNLAIDVAVKEAYCYVGLPVEKYDSGYDLQKAGKVQDILHHVSALLGREHNLKTVGDVVNYLNKP